MKSLNNLRLIKEFNLCVDQIFNRFSESEVEDMAKEVGLCLSAAKTREDKTYLLCNSLRICKILGEYEVAERTAKVQPIFRSIMQQKASGCGC